MPGKVTNVSAAKAEEGSLELTEELIRLRAYQLYEGRGCEHGHDLDDWFQAVAEVFGKKSVGTAESEAKEGKGKAAAA